MSGKKTVAVWLAAGLLMSLGAATPLLAQTSAAAAPAKTPGFKIDGDYQTYWLPPDVSQDGHKIDRLINVLHVFMAVLFVGWGVFFIYCLVKFRQRPGVKAQYEPVKAAISKYGEIGVIAFEAVLLLGFSIPIWASVKNDIPTDAENPLRIRVLGEQFAWNFHYPGADGKFGRIRADLVNSATNPMGLDKSGDPNAADDVVAGEMHIPVNRPIICDISAKDVIHSFSVPVLRVKQDAIPGMTVPVWFKAVKEGIYEVACAQLCGNNHYAMRALMFIEPQTKFDAWMAEKSKPPEEFTE